MTSSLCPLYKEAVEAKPWDDTATANAGLLFDKFASAWTLDDKKWGFDKGKGPGSWLRRFAKACGDKDAIAEACQRQRDLATALGGVFLCITNTSRFVTGMGRQHPLENGFTWHHTLGVPYLPGSGLKGLLRAWMREAEGTWAPEANKGKGAWVENEQYSRWFGSQNDVGRFILLDMLPASPPKLAIEIMTPHYGPYYQDPKGETPPADWHSPVPIQFLAVEKGNAWQLAILPVPGKQPLSTTELEQLKDCLVQALEWLGAGAKTAVGYGRFERDDVTEEELRRAEAEKTQAAAAEQKRHEQLQAELQGLSEPAKQLRLLALNGGWDDDNAKLLDGLEAFKENGPKPDADCVRLIRKWLETRYKGIWNDPDKREGKKNKPAFKPRPATLVKHFKQFEH